MKLLTKYQISAINSCWEKCDKNVYKCSMCIKTNYVGKQEVGISDFCHQQLLRKMRRKISWTDEGQMEGRTDRRTDRQTDRGKTIYPLPFGDRGYKKPKRNERIYISISQYQCRYNQKYHRVSDNEKQLSVWNILLMNKSSILPFEI